LGTKISPESIPFAALGFVSQGSGSIILFNT